MPSRRWAPGVVLQPAQESAQLVLQRADPLQQLTGGGRHVAHVLAKLETRDRTQAVIVAYETGLVHPS